MHSSRCCGTILGRGTEETSKVQLKRLTIRSCGQVEIRVQISILDKQTSWISCKSLANFIRNGTASIGNNKLRIHIWYGKSDLTSTMEFKFFTYPVFITFVCRKTSWDSTMNTSFKYPVSPITHDFKNAFGGRTRPLSSCVLTVDRCLLSKNVNFSKHWTAIRTPASVIQVLRA